MVRRMKQTYPVAIQMVERGVVSMRELATHLFPAGDAARAFAENDCYARGMIKAIVTIVN